MVILDPTPTRLRRPTSMRADLARLRSERRALCERARERAADAAEDDTHLRKDQCVLFTSEGAPRWRKDDR